MLHKRGRYYIVHFKELFALDGREVNITDEDLARRNAIANTLERWGLLAVLSKETASSPVLAGRNSLFILPYREKKNWNLEAKYAIGGEKVRRNPQ